MDEMKLFVIVLSNNKIKDFKINNEILIYKLKFLNLKI